MIRATLTAHGRVQGIGYRANARRKAQQYGIRGYVANQPDGSVQLVAEGDEELIDRLTEWCRHGPTGAHVTRLDIEKSEPTHEFRDFEIKR
jgi:acylphosphatase